MVDCVFDGNSVFGNGGGISKEQGSLTVTGCTFSNNSAQTGGGVWNWGVMTMTDCTFTGNDAAGQGGGLANTGNDGQTISGCLFTGNTAASGGVW